jgi:hypothetical protein
LLSILKVTVVVAAVGLAAEAAVADLEVVAMIKVHPHQ